MSKKTIDPADARERKRARFDENQAQAPRTSRNLLVAVAIAVVALIGGGLYVASTRGDRAAAPSATDPHGPASKAGAERAGLAGGTSAANAPTLVPEGDVVRLPAANITPQAAFYKVNAGGTDVPFFTVRDASGQTVVALDACNVCAHAKKGYEQQGDKMLCKNCGMGMPVNGLASMGAKGGCHPITLATRTEGAAIVVDRKELEAGAKYFS
jgi:hypothetical protein